MIGPPVTFAGTRRAAARVVFVGLVVSMSLGCARGRARAPVAAPTSGYCSPGFQAQFGWADAEKAARVCQCESSGNPRALAPGGRYAGLFQFSQATWKELGGGDVFDPYANSRQAVRLWQKRGWKPWPGCGK